VGEKNHQIYFLKYLKINKIFLKPKNLSFWFWDWCLVFWVFGFFWLLGFWVFLVIGFLGMDQKRKKK